MKTLVLISILFSSIFSFSQNLRTPEEVKQFNREFIRLINIERKKLNIDTLIESGKLMKQSEFWSKECITKNFFKHSDRESRLDAAEGINYSTGFISVNESVKFTILCFKESQSHWEILMSSEYKKIGVSEYMNSSRISTKYEKNNNLRESTVTIVQLSY
jgi:uncharacterized protein YkwD